jgi:type IV fimbrial biogenesis protein FimT
MKHFPSPVSRCGAVRGMTLVETMVCLLIVGILVSLAAPAFRDVLKRQRIAAVRGELVAAMHLARWEAVRSNAPVSLQRRNACAALLELQSAWDCGWDVVTMAESGVRLLQTFSLPPGVRLTHAGGGATLQFGRSGMPTLVAHKFIIGHSAEVTASTTVLCINRTGRVRTVTGRITC